MRIGPDIFTCECSHQTHAGQHGDINASRHAQSLMGQECSKDRKGSELCYIANKERNTICVILLYILFTTNLSRMASKAYHTLQVNVVGLPAIRSKFVVNKCLKEVTQVCFLCYIRSTSVLSTVLIS